MSFRDVAMVTRGCLYAPLHRVVAQAAKEKKRVVKHYLLYVSQSESENVLDSYTENAIQAK